MTEPEKIIATVGGQGQLLVDAASLPPEVAAQLMTPEAQAVIRRMYKQAYGTGRRETQQVRLVSRPPKVEQRDFRGMKPPGMTNKEFRKHRRKVFREMRKEALRGERLTVE
jgi:hypothetical protein